MDLDREDPSDKIPAQWNYLMFLMKFWQWRFMKVRENFPVKIFLIMVRKLVFPEK